MKKPPDPLLPHPVSLPSCLCSQPNPFSNLCAPSTEGYCEFIERRSPQRRCSQASQFHHHRPCYLALWLNPDLGHSQPPCLNPLMAMPCTIQPSNPIPKCSALTNSEFPHDWLLQDVDFLAPPEACEIQICKLGRNWYATVLLSIAVFLDSVPMEYQKVKFQSASDNDALRPRESQISLLLLSASFHHALFYPTLPKLILAYLKVDDINLYIMELRKRIKKEPVFCVDNYVHRLFCKAFIFILEFLVDTTLPIICHLVSTIWFRYSLSEYNPIFRGPSLGKFGSLSCCKNDVADCHNPSRFYASSGTLSLMIPCWVELFVWELDSEHSTWSNLLICTVFCTSVFYWNRNDMSVTHDKQYMHPKEWTRMIYGCNDLFNQSLDVGFHICSTELPNGTFILCIVIIDGCGFLSKPWRFYINSEYGQLHLLYQLWSRLYVMHHYYDIVHLGREFCGSSSPISK